MTSSTLLVVIGDCVLAASQLLLGVAMGFWIHRTDKTAYRRGRHDMLHAAEIAKRLQMLANEMSSSVGKHRNELEQASQLLTADSERDDGSIAELMGNVVGDVVLSNQKLQAKLDMAEGRLEDQAAEIEAHISRSLTDPLTGLPNRREFNERLEERMGAWNRRREVFSLMLLDVDHFKKLNDVHGHVAGDQMLAAVGAALRSAIRREDAIARYGGEEFAILLPNTSLEQAAVVAEKVREAVARTVVNHNGHRIAVTISGGIAAIQPNEEVEALIQRADKALYAAKGAGRNCAVVDDGADHRLSAGQFEQQPTGPAARLVEFINSSGGEGQSLNDSSNEAALDFGSYLPRESISTALAETCQELRGFLERRGQSEHASSSAHPS